MNDELKDLVDRICLLIEELDVKVQDDVYKSSTVWPLKGAVVDILENMISQEANIAKEQVLEEGYYELIPLKKRFGLVSDTERNL